MIHPTLLRKEIRENRVKFYLFLAALGLLAALVPLLFEPTRDLFRNADLGPYLDRQQLEYIGGSYNSYAWSQWTAKNLTQIGTLAAIFLGMGAFSSEAAYGTALFLLSKPITRREIFTSKVVAGLLLLAALVAVPTLVFGLISSLKGFTYDYPAFLTTLLIAFTGLAVVYLGTVIFSVLINDPVKAGVAAALFWLAVSIPGYFVATARLSIFYQIKAIPFWIFGQSPIVPLGLFLVLAGVLYETGVWLWSGREI